MRMAVFGYFRLPQSPVSRVLLVHSFLCTCAGVGLLLQFSYSNSFELLRNLKFRSRSSQRFLSCIFFFLWLACSAATIYRRRVELLAVATGLFCAIVTVAFPLEDLDAIRHIVDKGGLSELRILSTGEVLSYCGALSGYMAIAFESKDRHPQRLQLLDGRARRRDGTLRDRHLLILAGLTLAVLVFCVLGCSLLWTADASKYTGLRPNEYRTAIFGMADISIVVTFVFMMNYLTGDDTFVWLAAVLTGTYGIPLLYNFYNIADQMQDDIDKGLLEPNTVLRVGAGSWLLFLTHMAVLLSCVWLSQRPNSDTTVRRNHI